MINGFILSAGFGERLRPITNHIPKPLLPILGKPILDYILEKFVSSGIKSIGINLHYKQEPFYQWVQNHINKDSIKLFVENEILGTGGALKNAGDFLSSHDVFVTHNGDIFSDLDISKLISAHDNNRYLATLAVVDYQPINSLIINDEGLLTNLPDKPFKRMTFTGIAVYSSKILPLIPNGYSSIVDTWRLALQSGFMINTFDISDYYWSDIGHFDSYAKTIFDLLQRQGKRVYISKDFEDCSNIEYRGFLVIEDNCKINKPSVFENTIIMPNTVIEDFTNTSCNIVGNDFVISLDKSILQRPLGTGGSNRVFLRDSNENTIRMYCPKGDIDFHWHIVLTQYLRKRDIPVPHLISYNKDNHSAVFEDLGDLSLYDWLMCQRDLTTILEMYEKVIDAVVKLHSLNDNDFYSDIGLREFDYQYFLWETDYFIENFIKSFCQIDINTSVYDDLSKLANKASSFNKTIIHRDLQSQNIMIKSDKSIAFIDYQSARLGPPAYDIASLAFDPYVRFSDELRDAICDMYINKRQKTDGFNKEDFIESFSTCKLQRLMQALGAYAFLSIKKGKSHFLNYIPEALNLLIKAISKDMNQYPSLQILIKQAKDSI